MNKIRKNKPCVVTIAGSDSSGGAGIQADIKTISALGGYAASVITALTAQNTCGVQAVEDIAPRFIAQQIQSVFTDLSVSAVKLGMLHRREVIEVIAAGLEEFNPRYVVLDPVMVSNSGCLLLESGTIDFLKSRLFKLATLITPNLFETEQLLQKKITTVSEMEESALYLGKIYQTNILIKGGHLKDVYAMDVLYTMTEDTCYRLSAERIETKNIHGTGCTLSSAIATYLACGKNLLDAVQAAKDYLTGAIRAGAEQTVGRGHGPVDHFYFIGEK